MIFDRFANLKYKYGNRHFWCRGYFVDTVGRNKTAIQKYIQNQLSESYGKQVQGIDLVNGKLDEQIEKLQTVKKERAKKYLSEAGAQGDSYGDFEYAYKAMTERKDYMTYIDNNSNIIKQSIGKKVYFLKFIFLSICK